MLKKATTGREFLLQTLGEEGLGCLLKQENLEEYCLIIVGSLEGTRLARKIKDENKVVKKLDSWLRTHVGRKRTSAFWKAIMKDPGTGFRKFSNTISGLLKNSADKGNKLCAKYPVYALFLVCLTFLTGLNKKRPSLNVNPGMRSYSQTIVPTKYFYIQ